MNICNTYIHVQGKNLSKKKKKCPINLYSNNGHRWHRRILRITMTRPFILHNSACSSRTQKTFNINYACGHKWLGFQFQSVTSIVARFYVLHAISLYDFGFEYFKKWNKTELLVIKKKIEEHFIINYVFHPYTYIQIQYI